MLQVLQQLASGATEVADVPAPAIRPHHLLIRTQRSLLSAGTERMLVEFGRAGWLEKARQQPDKVRQAIEKARTDGIGPTIAAIRSRLDQPLALGYSNVGRVLEAGPGTVGFALGDRVVSNGSHAEIVSVPQNLCARVPAAVSDDEAAFAVIAAIALQGIRLVQPTLGESVVVTGLGLIGLITVQLLRAHGCRVLGVDFDPARLSLARQFGAETVPQGSDAVLAAAQAFSRGRGVDAVILTASTDSNEPVRQAAAMCRKRGRLVLVGVSGLALSRADFYEKELTFQVSCSYGPGRYDPSYEENGIDYPFGFVRWTEQRNFEAVLDMMADRRIDVRPLITHRFAIDDAARAYELITGAEPSLGVLFEYADAAVRPDALVARPTVTLPPGPAPAAGGAPTVGFIGAGTYATALLLDAFAAAGAQLHSVASARGLRGFHAARKFKAAAATTDAAALVANGAIDAVVVATRHDSHSRFVVAALEAGKHVFVEKPLALRADEIDAIERAVADAATRGGRAPVLTVGFNRRFAPLVQRMRELLAGSPEPKAAVMTINAGAVPPGHWVNDPVAGGGRILGEACHFVDLLRFLIDAPIVDITAVPLATPSRPPTAAHDSASITMRFADGSIGTIHYFANGHKRLPKERLELFTSGRVLMLDNFRVLRGYGWPWFRRARSWRQDKGQRACAKAFVDAVSGTGGMPIPLTEIFEVSRAIVRATAALDSTPRA